MCKIREMNLETAKYYGYEAQSNQLVEECAELIQAVNKYRRVETGLGQPVAEDKKAIARDNLVEEIADVELMLEQVLPLYRGRNCRSNRRWRDRRGLI